MIHQTTRGTAHRGRPHHHHQLPHPDMGPSRVGGRRSVPGLALSLEGPGRRRMRGLTGRDDREADDRSFGMSGRGAAHDRGRHSGGSGHDGPRPHAARLQARRGAIREAILGVLAEQPMHGYQVMQELADRSDGRWRPSAGSIYPTLQQLEDEGLVAAEDRDGRKTFVLTATGRTAATAVPAERPWSRRDGGDDLRGLAQELGVAALQVARVGSPNARAEARKVLTEARRALYRLLADDDSTSTEA